eukprot:m51a1_g12317 ribose-phosphate diphosphokinase, putative (331) ;mRNA; r:414003-415786
MSGYQIKIVSGSANNKLAQDVADLMNPQLKLTPLTLGRFSDGEIRLQVLESVRGHDLFIIQPTCPPNVNDFLQELLLLAHTLRLSSAARVTLVIPYYGYARQDRKVEARVPISALVVAKQLLAMEPNRFVFVDLHCDQIQGFFGNIPNDHLSGTHVFAARFLKTFSAEQRDNMVIVSPDAGGVTRARRVADAIGVTSMATILKRRVKANQIESMQLVGDVAGKACILIDDMIDTAGTLCKAAEHLKQFGASEVYAAATHGIFSGAALERIMASPLKTVWTTDTMCQEENIKKCPKIEVISIAPVIASAINAIHAERSMSMLDIWETSKAH